MPTTSPTRTAPATAPRLRRNRLQARGSMGRGYTPVDPRSTRAAAVEGRGTAVGADEDTGLGDAMTGPASRTVGIPAAAHGAHRSVAADAAHADSARALAVIAARLAEGPCSAPGAGDHSRERKGDQKHPHHEAARHAGQRAPGRCQPQWKPDPPGRCWHQPRRSVFFRALWEADDAGDGRDRRLPTFGAKN
jgi:hypothetical protein